MCKDTRFKFYIDVYSPERFPMSKLAQYMADFAELLGKEHAVHFERLEGGSTTIVALAEREDVPKVRSRLDGIRRGTDQVDLQRLIDRLNERLANDNAVGKLLEETDERGCAELITFEGRERPRALAFGPFNQEGHLDGLLISVGGKDESISIRLQNGAITYTNIETTRVLARELARYLFEPVRIHGTGRWMREASGEWTLRSFRVRGFDVLENVALRDAVNTLRTVKGSGWESIEDPLAELRDLRRDDKELH